MKVEFTSSPSNAEIDFLTKKINEATPGKGDIYSFAFFIREDEDKIIAGCNGSILFGTIYTDQLWVDAHYRKQGLGEELMECIHQYGRQVGCKMATVSTMSFQHAKKFYEDLGYVCDFERTGYVDGSSFFFLKKAL